VTERILLIEDDPRLAEMVKNYLGEAGFAVTVSSHGIAGIALEARGTFDALVLDLMLPDIDGLEVCRRIRARSQTPILMLTARGDAMDRVVGLEIGADDYLPKPFEPRELILRLNNIIRRHAAVPEARFSGEDAVSFGPFSFRIDRGELRRENEPVKITEREREILTMLAQTRGGNVERETLAGNGGLAAERTIDVQINRLRRKIEPDPANPSFLHTVRGVGYRLAID
jgi:two-component system phosphate regulon response regulator OmpR